MEVEDAWIKYSEMDTSKYTGLITVFSGVTSLFTHPLNVITTRQQASAMTAQSASSQNLIKALGQNYRDIGLRGLFRGWGVITVMGLPSQVMYLHATEVSREYLQDTLRSCFPEAPATVIDMVQTTASSIVANVVSNIPYVPAEVISNKMIVQGRDGLRTAEMTKRIYCEDGFRGYYRGFGASLSLGIMYSAQWWFVYSVFRREAGSPTHALGKYLTENPVVFDASSGLVAGQLTTLVLHPLDTVKTLIMTDPSKQQRSVFARGRDVIHHQGVKSLWRGIGASMAHSAFSCSGFAIIYEVIKRFSVENQAKKKRSSRP
jgi:hypothetical protein